MKNIAKVLLLLLLPLAVWAKIPDPTPILGEVFRPLGTEAKVSFLPVKMSPAGTYSVQITTDGGLNVYTGQVNPVALNNATFVNLCYLSFSACEGEKTYTFKFKRSGSNKWLLKTFVDKPTTNTGGGGGSGGSTIVVVSNIAPTTINQQTRGTFDPTIVPEFTLPTNKVLVFMGAGRNKFKQGGKDVFNWGFTHVDKSRMYNQLQSTYPIEIYEGVAAPSTFSSPIPKTKRCVTIGGNYYDFSVHDIKWASNYNYWSEAWFENNGSKPSSPISSTYNQLYRNLGEVTRSIKGYYQAVLNDYNGFPLNRLQFDVENIGDGNEPFFQEHTNLWVHLLSEAKGMTSSQNTISTLEPVAYNGFGRPELQHYSNTPKTALWDKPAVMTANASFKGMPSAIVGKSVRTFLSENMAGNYNNDIELLDDGIYPAVSGSTVSITHGLGQHWLANLLGNQEINNRVDTLGRVAWQWLFNNDGYVTIQKRYDTTTGYPRTDMGGTVVLAQNSYPDIAFPAEIAEGMGVWLFASGAKGAVLWDNCQDLNGIGVSAVLGGGINTAYTGQGIDRNYTSYLNYLDGLRRLFSNNSDVFDGTETYTNELTEFGLDTLTFVKKNAVEIQQSGYLPYVRTIINRTTNKAIIVAQKPYNTATNIDVFVRIPKIGGGYNVRKITIPGKSLFIGKTTIN